MEREQVELKLQVDGRKNRVLFAECGSDFVDLLFALLTLPLSTIIRLTHKRPELGSTSKLYESVAKLDGGSFHSASTRAMLLSAYSKPDYEAGSGVRFQCGACSRRWVSTLGNAPCGCGRVMDQPHNSNLYAKTEGEKRNVFVGEGLRFVVSDDLRVMPLSIRSTFSLLHELGVEDCTSFRDELVTVGVEELLNLLRHSLVSKQPLTDAFLQQPSVVLDPLPGLKLVEKARPLKEITKLSNVKMDVNVELKLFFDKSSDTILYAEAGEDFVDLVFSFMTFPLGCVVKLLDGNSAVGCMDNLTNSIEVLEEKKYMKDGVVRNMVHLKHNIGFRLQDLALPLAEELQIPLYGNCWSVTFESGELDIMLNKKFMRGPANFIIMNNLEIVPASPIAGLSLLRERRVSLNDVQDRVLQIGQEEALTLLKASLKSGSALNDFFQAICRAEVLL